MTAILTAISPRTPMSDLEGPHLSPLVRACPPHLHRLVKVKQSSDPEDERKTAGNTVKCGDSISQLIGRER